MMNGVYTRRLISSSERPWPFKRAATICSLSVVNSPVAVVRPAVSAGRTRATRSGVGARRLSCRRPFLPLETPGPVLFEPLSPPPFYRRRRRRRRHRRSAVVVSAATAGLLVGSGSGGAPEVSEAWACWSWWAVGEGERSVLMSVGRSVTLIAPFASGATTRDAERGRKRNPPRRMITANEILANCFTANYPPRSDNLVKS